MSTACAASSAGAIPAPMTANVTARVRMETPLLPSWMELPVNGSKIVPIDVRVDLRRRQVGMPEHLLHGAEVSPTLEEMRRERVPERVRGHPLGDPRALGGLLDDPPGADS